MAWVPDWAEAETDGSSDQKVPGVPDPTYGGDKKKELYSKYLKCLAGYLKVGSGRRGRSLQV